MESVEIRVSRGFKLLTDKLGPDWINRIDLETLNVFNPICCVLGQLGSGDCKSTHSAIFHCNFDLVDFEVLCDMWVCHAFTGQCTEEWKRQISAARLLNTFTPEVVHAEPQRSCR